MLVPAHRETHSPGYEPTWQPLAPKVINGHWGPLPKINYYASNLSRPPRDAKKCRATRMEEGPKVTLDFQCLWQGGRAALTLTYNYFLHRRGSGHARAIMA